MSEPRVALFFPGQGSQHVGMGRDLADSFPEAARVWQEADDVLGFGLAELCWNGLEAELTLTQNAQPAILVHSAAVWALIGAEVSAAVVGAAGHSLGEFSALFAAGALPFADVLRLVRRRGELMTAAGRQRPGTMAAVLGLADEDAEQLCRAASRPGEQVVPANFNSPGQLVISGDPPAVERATAAAREAGARRVLPLNVSGAFHSPLMENAARDFADALAEAAFSAPRFPVISNVTAAAEAADEAPRLLLRQFTAPVRWTESVLALQALGASQALEVGPGAVLSGLAKRIAPGLHVEPLGTAATLERWLANREAAWS